MAHQYIKKELKQLWDFCPQFFKQERFDTICEHLLYWNINTTSCSEISTLLHILYQCSPQTFNKELAENIDMIFVQKRAARLPIMILSDILAVKTAEHPFTFETVNKMLDCAIASQESNKASVIKQIVNDFFDEDLRSEIAEFIDIISQSEFAVFNSYNLNLFLKIITENSSEIIADLSKYMQLQRRLACEILQSKEGSVEMNKRHLHNVKQRILISTDDNELQKLTALKTQLEKAVLPETYELRVGNAEQRKQFSDLLPTCFSDNNFLHIMDNYRKRFPNVTSEQIFDAIQFVDVWQEQRLSIYDLSRLQRHCRPFPYPLKAKFFSYVEFMEVASEIPKLQSYFTVKNEIDFFSAHSFNEDIPSFEILERVMNIFPLAFADESIIRIFQDMLKVESMDDLKSFLKEKTNLDFADEQARQILSGVFNAKGTTGISVAYEIGNLFGVQAFSEDRIMRIISNTNEFKEGQLSLESFRVIHTIKDKYKTEFSRQNLSSIFSHVSPKLLISSIAEIATMFPEIIRNKSIIECFAKRLDLYNNKQLSMDDLYRMWSAPTLQSFAHKIMSHANVEQSQTVASESSQTWVATLSDDATKRSTESVSSEQKDKPREVVKEFV